MCGGLAGGIAAVVTTGAIGRAVKGAVIRLGTAPAGGRFVATLAARRSGNVTAGFTRGGCAVVAT